MPLIDLKVPSPGESITEVVIAKWLVKNGDYVQKDQELAEVDSDKATLTLNAEHAGAVMLISAEGDTVKVGDVACKVDTDAIAPAVTATPVAEVKTAPVAQAPVATVATPASTSYANGTPSPTAAKTMAENNINASQVSGSGKDGRITNQDVVAAMAKGFDKQAATNAWVGERNIERVKMTPLRKKLAQRLVSVKQETAMLTTFNEIDMSAIMELRNKYKDKFKEKHGTNLGFMSFFTKAVTEALGLFPAVNAMIDGEEIVYHKYADIGIAVSAPKGLVVPVLRNAEMMSLAGIEAGIKALALKARDNKITVDDMTGGTFTITNGGVFGSLMSTPIINPPQVAILGMHNIVERPIAVNGKVEIRPMMYVALSYDHRVIDGRESVGFLVKVKEMCENPTRILFGAKDPQEVLLGL
ncbi:MAG: 2-oxoglutarate dehydrogenase complex dihydrolipoyllysine-residue succinyltransferase [Bacteroidia bacterium]